MGNFASSAFRTPSTAALPSDAVVIDCAWLEATHTHYFKDVSSFQVVPVNEKKESTSLTTLLAKSCRRATTTPLWVRDALRCCSQTLRALVTSSASVPTPIPAPVNDHELFTAVQGTEDECFFDEFNQVFEFNVALKKSSPVSTFVLPSDAVIKTVGAASSCSTLAKMKSLHNVDENEDEDDYEDFEDCASYTTDATDSLSESECEGKCFAFCGGLECEPQHQHNTSQNDDIHDPLYSDDEDCDGDNEDCLAKAERLLRMASSCSDISIFLDDYLCTCGECPQYKLIAYEVQRYGTYADEAEMRSLTRILQAFSTYNEVIGYDCDMIPTAEECLQVWAGDELQAFKSFVTLYDEVPHLCAC
ncbi:hypothetical protein Gpo141_00004658 [Globisporangium polare]